MSNSFAMSLTSILGEAFNKYSNISGCFPIAFETAALRARSCFAIVVGSFFK